MCARARTHLHTIHIVKPVPPQAKMYEAMSEVYKLVMPIHESRRAFDKLDKLHGKLQTGYQRILARGDKWLLGSFFRVGFYGSLFNDLDGQEFIYKEEGHTRLATFSLRLEVGLHCMHTVLCGEVHVGVALWEWPLWDWPSWEWP